MSIARQVTHSFVCAIAATLTLVAIPGFGDDPSQPGSKKTLDPGVFLQNYCIDCHTADDPSGEREFETLDLSNSHFDNQLALQEIIDQLTLGTMPPEDGDQPSTDERLAAIKSITAQLTKMREQTGSTGGRTVLRRLSKREYRRTIGDLLAIDMTMFDPTLEFPADTLSGQFDNVGNALVTSGHLLERYLDAADQCVEKALAPSEKPVPHEWVFKGNFFQQAELSAAHKHAFNNRFICLYDHPNNDKPEGAFGHVSQFKSGVPVDGIYEIRVHAKSMHRDTPYGHKAVRIDLSEPFRMGIRPGDTSLNDMVHTQPLQPKLAETVIADDAFHWYTLRVPLDRGFAPRFTFENGIHDVRGSFGRVYRLHKETLPKSIHGESGIYKQRIAVIQHGQMPHIRIDEVQIRGPIDFAWPTASQKLLTGNEGFSEANAGTLIASFASRAFRRPATKNEADGLVDLYRSRVNDGHPPSRAFNDALKAALCSPGFLYFQQPEPDADGKLTPHALAERLSYFLTSTMPDDRSRRFGRRDAPWPSFLHQSRSCKTVRDRRESAGGIGRRISPRDFR